MTETKLTPVEASVQGVQMREHRAKKCHRCCGRLDLTKGGFRCGYGEDAQTKMADIKGCKKFTLDEDQERWLS